MTRAGLGMMVLLAVGLAAAHASSAESAGGGDRTETESILKAVEASGGVAASGKDGGAASSTGAASAEDLVRQARLDLERGARMRAAGDDARARLAEGAAKEWAVAARELVSAVAEEERAATVRRSVLDAGAQVERERALLEESTARIGRLRAQLENAKTPIATEGEARGKGAPGKIAPGKGPDTGVPGKPGKPAGSSAPAPRAPNAAGSGAAAIAPKKEGAK